MSTSKPSLRQASIQAYHHVLYWGRELERKIQSLAEEAATERTGDETSCVEKEDVCKALGILWPDGSPLEFNLDKKKVSTSNAV